MKAYLQNGTVVDLGTDYIQIQGEYGVGEDGRRDGDHIVLHDIRATALGCVLDCAMTVIDDRTGNLIKRHGVVVSKDGAPLDTPVARKAKPE